MIGFFNDYSNLVGTCTASTGGNCTLGDQFDGGEARVSGFEASGSYDFGDSALSIPLQAGYTWTDAEFRSSFVSSFEEWATVTRGDELPYLPEHTLFARIGVETARWSFNVGSNYIDDMRTRAGQGDPAPTERTDSAWVFDLAARYRVNDVVELYTRVENLGDKDYISSWRPAGARPGRERTALAGVRLKF